MIKEININEVWDIINRPRKSVLMFGKKSSDINTPTSRAIKIVNTFKTLIYYIECSPEVINTFNIIKVPQFRVFYNGNETKCFVGVVTEETMFL